jgi:hypothetical protein
MRAQQQRDAHAMAMKDAADSRRAEAARSRALRAATKEEAEEQVRLESHRWMRESVNRNSQIA